MPRRATHPLLVIATIVVLALVVAWMLFAVLSSEGTFAIEGKMSFGGAAAAFFVTLFGLRRWYDHLEERRGLEDDPELVKAIANLISADLVTRAEGDPIALTTLFDEIQQYLPVQFRSLGPEWVDSLIAELRSETQLSARAVSSLRGWEPPETVSALVEEVVSGG